MPVVSVIIPAHNRADLLGQTLQSVRDQTFTDWECIVVDDASTDHTPQVALAFASEDRRFRLIRRSSGSAAAARNAGAADAGGEFLAFLDSDDLFEPDKLHWQVEALRREPEAVMVYGDTYQFVGSDPWNPESGSTYLSYVQEKPRGPTPAGFEMLLSCSAIYAPLVRASAFRDAGGFDLSLPSGEDWDMWLAVSRLGTLLYEPRQALRYRLHPGNKSANTLRNYRCALKVAAKHLKSVPRSRRSAVRRATRARFQRGYVPRLLAEADQATMQRNWPQARQLWLALIRLQPSLMLRRRHVLINGLLSLLPLRRRPMWRRWNYRPQASSPT